VTTPRSEKIWLAVTGDQPTETNPAFRIIHRNDEYPSTGSRPSIQTGPRPSTRCSAYRNVTNASSSTK
jgi:hypothetical protein